jgi:hypothetical protein
MTRKTKEWVLALVLVSIAVALIAISARISTFSISDLSSKLAFAVIIAVIIRAALFWLYGPDVHAFDKFQDLGMQKLYYPMKDEDLQRRLSESESIRVLKTWFPETTDIKDGLRHAIVHNKAKVRLLLCHPRSDLLQKRSDSAERNPLLGSRTNYEAVLSISNWLKDAPGADVKISFYDDWPGCPVIWYRKKGVLLSSQQIIMGFYFRKRSSPSWPWISVRPGSELARILKEQYEDLLSNGSVESLSSLEQMQEWLKENKTHASPMKTEGLKG